jgi:amino acid transporter
MIWGAAGLAICFIILTGFGRIAQGLPDVPDPAVEIPGSVTLLIATAIFGIGWWATVWLIPTEFILAQQEHRGVLSAL